MDKAKRKRAVFLALSGVCAVGAVLWVFVVTVLQDFILFDFLSEVLVFLERFLDGGIWVIVFLFNPLTYLAVSFFVKGYTPGKYMALKISVFACTALLGIYIAMVAFIKIDFVSPLPILIVCGITPVFAAFGVMLFYGGKKWRKALCFVLASLALLASTWTLVIGGANNDRQTIGYSKSPDGTHKIVVLLDIGWGYNSCVACPVYGLLYKQDNPEYVDPDLLQNIVWIDENTAQFDDRNGYPRTITFK